MALKFTVDSLDGLPETIREHYTKVGDKFQLATEGEHPKVTEFRDNNTRLMAEARKFEGVDPEEYRTLKARAAADDAPDVVALRAELVAKTAALTKTQHQADALIIETKISDAFLKVGGLPKARAFIIAAASPQFTVEDGVLKGKTFSPNHPGQPMTVDEWVLLQTKENSFCFAWSGGGGAVGNKGGGGTSTAKELQNPTPQQLGEHAAAIKRGDVKVTYTT